MFHKLVDVGSRIALDHVVSVISLMWDHTVHHALLNLVYAPQNHVAIVFSKPANKSITELCYESLNNHHLTPALESCKMCRNIKREKAA